MASLEEQIAELRQRVRYLEEKLQVSEAEKTDSESASVLTSSEPPPAHSFAVPPPLPDWDPPATAEETPQPRSSSDLRVSEKWFARIGIGLLLIGLALFLKLSLDRGWITPALQMSFGALLALALMGLGQRTWMSRPVLAHGLFGAGAAGLYVVIHASFLIHKLLTPSWALGSLAVLSLFVLWQSLAKNSSLLATMALAGALTGPIFYGFRPNAAPVIIGCALAVMAVSAVVQLRRGWLLPYLTSLGGGYLLLTLATSLHKIPFGLGYPNDRLLGAAYFLAWFFHWLPPQVRTLASANTQKQDVLVGIAAIIPAFGSLALFLFMKGDFDRTLFAGAFGTLAVISILAGLLLRRLAPNCEAYAAHMFAAIVFFCFGLTCWLEGDQLVAAFALALPLLWLSLRPFSHVGLDFAGHAWAFLLGFAYLSKIVTLHNMQSPSPAGALFVTALAGICLFAASFPQRDQLGRSAYRLAGLFAILALIWLELEKYQLAPAWIALFFALCSALAPALASPRWRDLLVVGHAACVVFVLLSLRSLFVPFSIAASIGWLLGIGIIGLTGWRIIQGKAGQVYLAIAHLFFVLWIWDSFHTSYPQWVSPLWAIYAVLLVGIGLMRNLTSFRVAGHLLLLLMLGRLFLIDFAGLDLIWRALVFLGIGGFLVAAGYFLPGLVGNKKNSA